MDQERYVQALAAIKATESPYRLFLAHFSDIDIQGHNFGVAPQFNKDNTYYKAITHKAKLVNELLNAADENTTVIVLADHGQVDAGGHGGTSPFNMEVPLVFYRKNSNFSNPALTGPPLLWQQLAGKYSNMDVAGTIDMLLGYPIPAMTQGYIVPEAFSLVNDGNRSEYERLVMKDLFKQKQDPPDYPSHQYLAESIELIKAYSQARSDWNSRFIIRNVVLVIFFNIITILTFIFLMEYFTFASPFCFVSLFNFNHSKHEYSAEVHKSLLKNRRAMILSFFAVLLQFALINIIFYAYYGTKGYGQVGTVDSTILHTPQVLPAYLVTVILTSWVTQYVVEKLFVLVHVDWSVIRTVGRSEYDLEAIDTNESSRGIMQDLADIALRKQYYGLPDDEGKKE
ncbi:alkaline-phosphatase-like protein [Paraphysoderma sedebokerense]|nr:alkaline-phosphatase-like protein [Paraphysoderma sedebokerense]